MPQPRLVSTIIPVFNRPQMLREVAGVLAQTYRPIEILIAEDGSTDTTAEVFAELASRHAEVRTLHAGSAGRPVARREFVKYLYSDILSPAESQLQAAALDAHPKWGGASGWTRMRVKDGTFLSERWRRSGEPIATMSPTMLASGRLDIPTPLYRASVLERAGSWSHPRVEEAWGYHVRTKDYASSSLVEIRF